MTNSRKKIISWIIFIVFSVVVLGSSFFIITHADHDCTDEDCSVCMEISECFKTIKTLGTALTGVMHLSVMLFALSVIVKSFTGTRSDHITLISLKVELLN